MPKTLNHPIPENEKDRLEALLKYEVLDTFSEEEFDNITKLASYICQSPIALISFIDEKRQWHKSKIGIEESEAPRETTFCQHTIMENRIMEIPNALENDTFKNLPAVTGSAGIRFYAGAPLTTPQGLNVGVICVIDRVPKKLDEDQMRALSTLSDQVIAQLELKKKNIDLSKEVSEFAKNALDVIAEELEIYKLAIDETSMVDIVDGNGIITHVNDRFCATSKYSREELIGQNHKLFHSGHHSDAFFKELWETVSSGSTWKGEIKCAAKDGSIFWEDSMIVPFLDEKGKVYKVVSIKQDITKQKQEDNKVDQFFNLSLDFLCIANDEGYFEKISPTFSAALGHTEEELLSQPFLNFVHKDDRERTKVEFSKLGDNITSISFENRYKCKNGDFILLSWNATLDKERELIFATARDMTKVKSDQEENKRLSMVAKNTNNIIIITDKDSNIQWVNEPFERLTKFTLQEIEGYQLFKFLNRGESSEERNAQINKAIKFKTPFSGEIAHKSKNGEKYWFQINLMPVFDDDNELINFIAIETDITENKEKNHKIKNLLKTQQAMFDGASYSIIFTDTEGKIKGINKACIELLGYDEKEVIGKMSPEDFHDPEEIKARNKELSQELGKPVGTGFETLVVKSRDQQKADTKEWTCVSKSGERILVWLSVTCISDNDDNILGYLLVAEDYTKKKKVEEELISAKKLAEQAVKMKDNFLANMSHEIRTPMNAIIGFTDILADTDLNEEQKDCLYNMKMAGENLMLIINDILDLSKIESGKLVIEKNPFNIKSTLKHVYDLLSVRAKEKALDFNLFLDADMPDIVVGDKGRINQIIMNLAGNAIKFTQRGEVNILVKKTAEQEDTITLKISVKDSGIGIAEDKLTSIFERFSQGEESTTRNFGGTGLGLNICQQLIELQNGKLNVRSMLGVGSEFNFSIQFAKVDDTLLPKEIEAKSPQTSARLSILLCEDNPINQKLVSKVMQIFGFSLDIAHNGEEGIALLAEKEYDLILMDLEMPKKDGYQTTAHIREVMKSDIPIIAMTAHSLVGEKQNCYDIGMNGYVPKPFKQQELLAEIQSVLADLPLKAACSPSKTTIINKDAPFEGEEIDLSYLQELSDESPEFEKEMMELFIVKVTADMKILSDAIKDKNFKTVKDIAHGLKSSLSLFQLNICVEFLSKLESEAGLGVDNPEASFKPDILAHFEVLKQKLEKVSDNLNSLLINNYSHINI